MKLESIEKPCLHCGRCCHIKYKDKIYKCPFLIEIKKNYFWCRIYKNRIGKIIFVFPDKTKFRCFLRKNVPNDYKDCPYNTNKPILDVNF